jgi:hypothetical protein
LYIRLFYIWLKHTDVGGEAYPLAKGLAKIMKITPQASAPIISKHVCFMSLSSFLKMQEKGHTSSA